jgi:hypothetical protein
MVHRYTGARWLVAIGLRDAVLVAALAIAHSTPMPRALAIVLSIAIPIVLAWGILTLHVPSEVEIDDDGVAFRAYFRTHRFAWREIRALRVRRFLVKDRVLVRVLPSSPWRGRYWLLDGLDGFDALVARIEARSHAIEKSSPSAPSSTSRSASVT